MARALERAGVSAAEASHKALAILYGQMQSQAFTLAYIDAIRVLGLATAAMVPLLLFTRRPKGRGAPGGH
jgi:hypothetical protein